MSSVICSIVAKNYLPLAFALGSSIKKFNPEFSFSILLADTKDGLETDIDQLPYKVHTLDSLSLSGEQITELAFKYNVTEFCTAVKPYYIDLLFSQGASKVIYFDPDIFLFSSIEKIFCELESKSIVVTPHFITPEINYSGTITEALLFNVGMFNFGFLAVKNDKVGKSFIKWWCNRLYNKCYQDKIDSYHTDQKWGDLLPVFWGSDILISKDLGRNVAFWNLHERSIGIEDGKYVVKNRIEAGQIYPLMFFHFAGYSLDNPKGLIHKNNPLYTFTDFPELKILFENYGQELLKSDYNKFINLKYKFNYFSDGKTQILSYQRRMYRRLLSDGKCFKDPFAMGKFSFYELLHINKLIVGTNASKIDKLNETNFSGFANKVKYLNYIMIVVKNILGSEKYFLLLKFCQRYFRVENQSFLFKEYFDDYFFINENREDIKK
jgi:hypothetical protein